MSTDMQDAVNRLLGESYTTIPVVFPADLLERVQTGFEAFIKDPQVTADNGWALMKRDPDDFDSGLVPRRGAKRTTDGDEGAYDDKSIYHHHRDTLQRFIAEGRVNIDDHQAFFDDLEILYHLWWHAIYKLMMALEAEFKTRYAIRVQKAETSGKSISVREGRMWAKLTNLTGIYSAAGGLHVIRLIAYHSVRPDSNGLLGEQHLDKSLVTTRFTESASGLRFAFNSFVRDVFKDLGLEPDHIAVFAGIKLEELTDHKLRALYHLIEDGEYTPLSETVKRFVIVGFTHGIDDIQDMRTH